MARASFAFCNAASPNARSRCTRSSIFSPHSSAAMPGNISKATAKSSAAPDIQQAAKPNAVLRSGGSSAPSGPLFEKTAGNVQEAAARGGRVILLTDRPSRDAIGEGIVRIIDMPSIDPFLAPILYAVPMQLLSYHVAVLKGTDVDQPRNLAKSVTVE